MKHFFYTFSLAAAFVSNFVCDYAMAGNCAGITDKGYITAMPGASYEQCRLASTSNGSPTSCNYASAFTNEYPKVEGANNSGAICTTYYISRASGFVSSTTFRAGAVVFTSVTADQCR